MQPITIPTPMPVNIAFFPLFSFPAPTFCDTKDAMDCIRELGISIAKLTTLQATPYPEEAASPSRLTNAQSARNEICVKNSCIASGRPTFNALIQCVLILKSCLVILNGSSLFTSKNNAKTTLTACAVTVAIAAPAASKCSPATKIRSPAIFTTHATATNNNGDLLSPKPLKIAASRLYATMKKIPPPQIRT